MTTASMCNIPLPHFAQCNMCLFVCENTTSSPAVLSVNKKQASTSCTSPMGMTTAAMGSSSRRLCGTIHGKDVPCVGLQMDGYSHGCFSHNTSHYWKDEKHFCHIGSSRSIGDDNSTPFTSANFEHFCTRNGIRHLRSTPYHLATNGIVEVVHWSSWMVFENHLFQSVPNLPFAGLTLKSNYFNFVVCHFFKETGNIFSVIPYSLCITPYN